MADISSNNGFVSIPSYSRAGHVAIAIKASQGIGYTNPYHANQARDAHDFGLTVIHYHFCDSSNVLQQIEHFRSVYLPTWRNGDYAAFDIERPELSTHWANICLELYHHKTGREPIAYVPESKLSGLIIPGHRLWFPWWKSDVPQIDRKKYTLWAWQYTDGKLGPNPHYASGIGYCDVSIIGYGPALAMNVRKIITKKRK